jgi:hypothetical protein
LCQFQSFSIALVTESVRRSGLHRRLILSIDLHVYVNWYIYMYGMELHGIALY